MRNHDNGHGIITGHPVEPLYGRTYLPKKFKIAFTVPGDNSVDLYINDIGCVVVMEADGVTLKGFNIVVGGGMGRTHRKEDTFARAADHLGFVKKEDFFEAMKAILAVQRDHGNREVRSSARLKYLVHTLGIDKFRELTEQVTARAAAAGLEEKTSGAHTVDWPHASGHTHLAAPMLAAPMLAAPRLAAPMLAAPMLAAATPILATLL